MKTVEQAAKEYGVNFDGFDEPMRPFIENAFFYGAEWQKEQIPVKDIKNLIEAVSPKCMGNIGDVMQRVINESSYGIVKEWLDNLPK
jgi:hypothetical protein